MNLGIDNFDAHKELFEGKRIGLITNPTGISSTFEYTIDILNKKANLVGLFSPEHGVRSNIQAGLKMDTYIDEKTGIKVYSLYGSTKKPTKEMMDELDIMAIDIQDAGSRFYTYIYTMAYAMMACKEYSKKFVVFDRPNPARADIVEGNILDLDYRSFIGYYPIVQRHGMTIGEIAKLFNEEYGIGCDLEVIKMSGYSRDMTFLDTKKLWVMPSPNFPTPKTALAYNATCVFEGTNIAEGRGTTAPFQIVGAPFIDPYKLADVLNSYHFKNVYFRPMYFTPTFSKYKDEMCGGVELHILDERLDDAVKISWAMVYEIRRLYPDDFKINPPYKEGAKCFFELNTGCGYVKENKYSIEELFAIIDKDTKEFMKIREKYLLY